MNKLTDRIDSIFAEWDKPDSPGCMLAVVKDGEFVYKRGYGMADLERGAPIKEASIFDLGSTGKQFTATVIAILASRGQLSLDDPIRKHLPEMPAYADEITVRHLIHHTSGIRDYLTLMHLSGLSFENEYPEAMLTDLITRQQGLNFKPGSEYLYSNSGYFLLGVIATRVTGKHITELIQELILTPLGMTRTTFNKDFRPIVKNRAWSYDVGEEEGTFINAIAMTGGFGDGALLSCVDDLLLWDQNFYKNKLNDAQPDLLDQLHTTGILNNGKPITYAFGLTVDSYRGQKRVMHAGGWAGYRSELMRFPDQRLTVICLSNLGSIEPTLLAEQVVNVYLEDVLENEKQTEDPANAANITLSESELAARTGVFQGKHSTYQILLDEGSLIFSNFLRQFPMTALNTREFQVGPFPIFVTFAGNNFEQATLVQGSEHITKLRKIRENGFRSSALDIYEGKFYSRELGIAYTIKQENGNLFVKRTPYDTPKQIHFGAENALRSEIGEMRLRFDRQGRLRGFVLHSGRVINIRFDKVH